MAGTATPEARCAVETGATTPLFPAGAGVPLPPNALLARARQCRLRTYASRHVIIDQGARTDHAIIVVEGWAELVMRLPDDRRQILAFAMPGDLCLDDIDRPARTDCAIFAVTPLTVAILGKFELRRLVADHAAFARDFRRNQMLSLAIQRRWTASLGRMEAIVSGAWIPRFSYVFSGGMRVLRWNAERMVWSYKLSNGWRLQA